MSDLDNARKQIDGIDKKMAELFTQRMEAVAEVGKHKAECGLPVYDAARESAVLQRNATFVDERIRPYYLQFMENTMKVSRQYQHRLIQGMRVAYSGVEGAFAWVAAQHAFPNAETLPYPDFAQAYHAVVSGEADCAVLPLENSTAGEVGQVIDLLFSGPLFVNHVFNLAVVQNLLGTAGAKLEDVRTVVSHPQALAQCARYIEEHGWATQEAANTAFAARSVAESGDTSIAAIAHAETAELYQLSVLDHDINEVAGNTTRFCAVSRTISQNTGERFMLMFTVRNEAGSLAKAINVIGDYGFNMHALHSHPMKSLAWQYYFYVEAEGDIYSDAGTAMMEKLAEQCDKLKVVGNYHVEQSATTNSPAQPSLTRSEASKATEGGFYAVD